VSLTDFPEGGKAITGTFLTHITTKSPYKDWLHGHFITIANAIVQRFQAAGGMINTSLAFLNCDFDEQIRLGSLRISGHLRFVGTNIPKGIHLDSTQIDGSLYFSASSARQTFTLGNIQASNMIVSREVAISHANAGRIHFSSLKADFVAITDSKVYETIFANGVISGQIRLTDTTFSESVSNTGAEKDDVLNLYSVQAKQVFFNRSVFDGSIEMTGIDVGSVHLLGAKFKDVNATGASVKGVLQIGDTEWSRNGPIHRLQWAPHSNLDLSYAKIGVIATPLRQDYWPESLVLNEFHPNGFEFSTLYELTTGQDQSIEDWAIAWLSKATKYSPQPYYAMQKSFSDRGDSNAATAIGYAGRDRELKQAWRDGRVSTVAYLLFSKLVIGYGYQIWLSGMWAVGLVIVGATVFHWTPESRRERMPYGLAYSFDMLLPLIKLREKHYEIDVSGWARYYFYFHKIAGWVLGLFIVAGLSGLTK